MSPTNIDLNQHALHIGFQFGTLQLGLVVTYQEFVTQLQPRCGELPHLVGGDGRYTGAFAKALWLWCKVEGLTDPEWIQGSPEAVTFNCAVCLWRDGGALHCEHCAWRPAHQATLG